MPILLTKLYLRPHRVNGASNQVCQLLVGAATLACIATITNRILWAPCQEPRRDNGRCFMNNLIAILCMLPAFPHYFLLLVQYINYNEMNRKKQIIKNLGRDDLLSLGTKGPSLIFNYFLKICRELGYEIFSSDNQIRKTVK